MGAIAGKTILFFDTCHSGNIVTGVKAGDQAADIDKFADELADAQSGVIVFTSSTCRQFSVEQETWENGAFTEDLLEGIHSRKADYQKDWYISVADLEVYVATRVSELTHGKQKPMTAKPIVVEDYKFIRKIIGGKLFIHPQAVRKREPEKLCRGHQALCQW